MVSPSAVPLNAVSGSFDSKPPICTSLDSHATESHPDRSRSAVCRLHLCERSAAVSTESSIPSRHGLRFRSRRPRLVWREYSWRTQQRNLGVERRFVDRAEPVKRAWRTLWPVARIRQRPRSQCVDFRFRAGLGNLGVGWHRLDTAYFDRVSAVSSRRWACFRLGSGQDGHVWRKPE